MLSAKSRGTRCLVKRCFAVNTWYSPQYEYPASTGSGLFCQTVCFTKVYNTPMRDRTCNLLCNRGSRSSRGGAFYYFGKDEHFQAIVADEENSSRIEAVYAIRMKMLGLT